MSMHGILIVFLLAAFSTTASATDVIGNINTQTIWTKANSPYVLTGDVTVASHASLTIEPGVVVKAAATDALGAGQNTAKVELIVYGTLTANGTASDPIQFKGPTDSANGWVGLTLDVGAKASSLTHARIAGATTGLYVRSSNSVTVADVHVESVNTGISWQSSAAMALERVRVENFESKGIVVNDNGAGGVAATVSKSVVFGGASGSTGIEVGPRVNATIGAVQIVGADTGVDLLDEGSLAISSSVIAGNFKYGLRLRQTVGKTVKVLNNTIDFNYTGSTGYGIRVESATNASSFIVRNNLVTNHPVGFDVLGPMAPSHDHNNVWNAKAGWTDYRGTTKGAGSITANPLYVEGISQPAPDSSAWTRVNESFNLYPQASYATLAKTITQPQMGWTRVVFSSSYVYSGGSIEVSDRNGVIARYTSHVGSDTITPVGVGLAFTVTAKSAQYSATSASVKGYEWVPYTWNYRLTQSSPAIDVGNALDAPADDADGTARPYDGDLDGQPKPDLGAYEWHENFAPTAIAGPDHVVLPNKAITFDGSRSYDPDGEIVAYDWDFGDGSAHATTSTASHTYAALGEYTVTLTVTDDLGVTSTDTATVTVANNLSPVARAGVDQSADIGQIVSFSGSGSVDEDGSIVAYDWDFGDGTPHGSGPNVTHSYARKGVFKVTLTVIDDRGAQGSHSVYVVVGSDGSSNVAPVAKAGAAQTVTLGDAVTVDGTASTDEDGTIASYTWSWGDGTANGSGATATHTYAKAGTFIVTLTVTDDAFATATDMTSVTVTTTANKAPVAKAGAAQTVTLGDAVTVDGSASTDEDGSIASYAWSWGDGTANGSGATATHTYAKAGTFIVTLTVTDDAGATATDVTIVTVTTTANQVPVAKAGGPYLTTPGATLVFDGSGSTDSDGTIVSWDWNFGDGATGTGAVISHTFASAGSYLVTLTVTDDQGATANVSVLASVVELTNRAPVAKAGGPYAAKTGETVLFDASDSTDSDGAIASWNWTFGDGETAQGKEVAHAYASAGSYLVRVTVTDDQGASDDDAVLVVISEEGNVPPVARAGGNRSGNVLEEIVFDAALSTDADGTIVSYAWDFGDGATAETQRANHAFAKAGTYLVKLVVADEKGAIGQDIALVSVGGSSSGNQSPLAVAGDDVAAHAGRKIVFNASGSSDPDGAIVAYQWDFGDGSQGAGLSTSHTYESGGKYTVTLTVFDNQGASASATLVASINELPVARFSGGASATVGQKLTFDASESEDVDGEIVEYRWTFGDGSKNDQPTVEHAWTAPGTYAVVLQVVDDLGAPAEATRLVTVTAAEARPVDSGCGCASTEPVSFAASLAFVLAWVAGRRKRFAA